MHRAHLTKIVRATLMSGVCGLAAVSALAQTAPDNTKTNTRDRAEGAVTADQQKENATDRRISQRIRQAIVDDKSLSTYAHNVKVVTQDGRVTLKGPVRSEAEKRAVEAKATEIAGAGKVTNQVDIAPADTPKTAPAGTSKSPKAPKS